MRTAFIEALLQEAERNPRIWLLNGDLGYSVLERFAERFPNRSVNVGVAEQNMIGIAAGLAMSGNIPFVYSIANFPTLRCLEQIRNDVVYHGMPVKIVAVGGGFTYGPQGYTHYGIEDLAVMSAFAGMTVVAPGDPVETSRLVSQIIDHEGPVYLRLGRAGEPVVHDAGVVARLGKALLVREGTDLTLISTGGMLKNGVDAADQLRSKGVRARLLSMHTVKPLDRDAVLRAADETGAILTLEEHVMTGGLGTAVADVLAGSGRNVRFAKHGVHDAMLKRVGSQAFMRRLMGDITERALLLIGAAAAGKA